MSAEGGIDWGFGELIAFGSLLRQGVTVRLAGQDSRRGTFVSRHASIVDAKTGKDFLPLSTLATGNARFFVHDSLLSEYAAMGFEYGYSVENPDALVALGGPVRRLRQRRPVDRGRVHLLRRGEVGPAVVAGAAAPARPGGPGPGPLVRPAGAVPAALRAGQHAGGQPDHPGELLPPAAPPGAVAASASRWWSSRRSRCCGTSSRCPRWPTSPRARSSRCSATPASTARRSTPARSSGCCSAPARSTTTCSRPGPSAASPTPRSSGWSRSTRCRSTELKAVLGAVPERRGLRLGPGGAGQPGRLVVRRAQPAGAPGGRPAAAHLPARGGRPGGRLGQDARRRAGGADRGGAAPPVTVTGSSRGAPLAAGRPRLGSGHVLHRSWHRGAGRAARRGDRHARVARPSSCAPSST